MPLEVKWPNTQGAHEGLQRLHQVSVYRAYAFTRQMLVVLTHAESQPPPPPPRQLTSNPPGRSVPFTKWSKQGTPMLVLFAGRHTTLEADNQNCSEASRVYYCNSHPSGKGQKPPVSDFDEPMVWHSGCIHPSGNP